MTKQSVLKDKYIRMWYTFKKRKVSILGLIIIAIYIFIALFAHFIAPYDPIKQDLSSMLQEPSSKHLFGTDEVGRDILSRIVYGTRLSLRVGFMAVGIGMVIGTPLGIVSGYFGGKIDTLIMRGMDVLMAFPGMILCICLVAVLGPSLNNAMIAMGIYYVPNFARTSRAETLSIKLKEFIEASKSLGADNIRIIFDHILVNILAPVIVMATLNFGHAILTTAGLGFLGIGAQPPTPEWGAMLSSGRSYLIMAPHVCTVPGLAIFFLVLGLNLFGDGVRDVFDPKMRE